MAHPEVDRARDETHLVRPLMQRPRWFNSGAVGDRHPRMQDDRSEFAAAIRVFAHRAYGRIFVRGDHDARFGAEVQHPQHVASGERGDQQLFRIVTRAVAAKGRVGAARNGHALLAAWDGDFVIARVGAIMRGAVAKIAGPDDRELVVMLFSHRLRRDGFSPIPFNEEAQIADAALQANQNRCFPELSSPG